MKVAALPKYLFRGWKKLIGFRHSYFMVFLGLGTIFLLVVLFFHKDPLIVIKANTRSLQYTVVNSERAAILFSTPVSIKIPRQKNTCITGLLKPNLSSNIKYWVKDDLMLIKMTHQEAEHVATWYPLEKGASPMKIPNGSLLAYGTSSQCSNKPIPPMSLPVWGPTKIGEIPLSANKSSFGDSLQGLLLSGKVNLFGRENFGTGIYPAGEFTIPAGVRLSSSGTGTESAWGYALFNPKSANEQFAQYEVSFTTIAENITVKRSENLQEDRIKVGFLSRLIGEPLYAIIGVIFAGLTLLGNFTLTIKGLINHGQDKE